MVQVGPKKASHRIRQETVLDALLGSLRFGSRLHSRPQRSSWLSCSTWNGSDWVLQCGRAQDKSCNVRWTGSQDFE
jgi:hypothetical protein